MSLTTASLFHVSVSSMPGPWKQVGDQESTREVTKIREEAGGPEVAIPGRVTQADLTVTRAYHSDRDNALYRRIAGGELFSGTTITVQELDPDGNAIPGAMTVYSGCVVKSATTSGGDADSEEPSTLTVVFAVGRVS